MKHWWKDLATILKATVGCAIFALGFDLFLVPNDLNAGGLTGLSMVLVHLIGYGTIGIVSALMNLPLFILAGIIFLKIPNCQSRFIAEIAVNLIRVIAQLFKARLHLNDVVCLLSIGNHPCCKGSRKG